MQELTYSGNWIGKYIYGNDYPDDVKGTEVSFTIEMTLTDGVVKGKCMEEDHNGYSPGEASIEGFIEDGIISFIKKYTHYSTEEFNHPIHYSGSYESGRFTGDWEIEASYIDATGAISTYFSEGTWTMQKADQQMSPKI